MSRSRAVPPEAVRVDDVRQQPSVGLTVLSPRVESLEIGGDEAWAEACRVALGYHLERMLQRVPGALDGRDAEDVHQMRLSARRMRAAWRVFGDDFQFDTKHRHVMDLRTIGVALGTVRDVDIHLEIVRAHQGKRGRGKRSGLASLLEAWSRERTARQAELVAILCGPGFASFVDASRDLVMNGGRVVLSTRPHAPATVRQRIGARIWLAYQTVWAFDALVRTADVETLHELRIATKWLRYTLEFARPLLQPEGDSLVAAVVHLQDHLGDIHDLNVTARQARHHLEAQPDLRHGEERAIAAFVEVADRRVARLRGSLGRSWSEVAGPGYRRRLGRGLSRL